MNQRTCQVIKIPGKIKIKHLICMFCFGFLFFFPRAPHWIRRSPRTAQPLTLLANSCGASGLPEKRIRRRREQPTSIYTLQQLRVAFGESARATCAPSRFHFLRKTLALAGPFARRTELRPRTEREREAAPLSSHVQLRGVRGESIEGRPV